MIIYQTRAVTKGDPRLTHVVEVQDGFEIEVLCGRVRLEDLACPTAVDHMRLPTCPVCRERLKTLPRG